MQTIFQKRRTRFVELCLKYLKYVLNDHFVLVVMFLLGFVLFQYRELLTHFPKQTLPVYLCLLAVLGVCLSFGRLATFVEPSDKLFLLPKEEALLDELKLARKRAFIFWGTLQVLVTTLILPILLALGWNWFYIFVLVFVQLCLKWLVFQRRLQQLMIEKRLDWDKAILGEKKRQQVILKFFALFTTVKGVSTSTKRRAYLDRVITAIPKRQDRVWFTLYTQAFLRSGDYLSLALRLTGLSLLAIAFIKQVMIAAGLALLFNYLLLFQLLVLYGHYDYQYMTQLFPTDSALKKANLLLFLRWIGMILVVIQGVWLWSLLPLLLFFLGMMSILYLYLPYKLKKMID
ncbi:ABC transporter permease [Streptococcus fryi]